MSIDQYLDFNINYSCDWLTVINNTSSIDQKGRDGFYNEKNKADVILSIQNELIVKSFNKIQVNYPPEQLHYSSRTNKVLVKLTR